MFQLNLSLNVSANNGKQTLLNIASSDVLVVLNSAQTFQGGDLIERTFKSGDTFSIRWIQRTLKGKLIPLSYGETEIIFDVPDLLQTFDLELIPSRLQFEYSVEIFTRIFDPIYAELTERLGIPLQLLQKMPEQILQILLGLHTMPSSDTRNVLEALEIQGQTIATQGTTIASQQAALDAANLKLGTVETELVTVKTESLIQEEFTLSQSDFILSGTRWVASKLLEALDGSKSVQMSCVDADGDEQGFSQLMHPFMGDVQKAAVELSATQYAENAYPLKFLVQGNRAVSQDTTPSGVWVPMPGGSRSFRVVDGNLENTENMGETFNLMGTAIAEAFICVQEFKVYARNELGECMSFESNGAFSAVEAENDYLARKSFPDSISL
jgi:hypothetical protein